MTNLPEPLKSILNLARWAPSGDNLQPWRFECMGADRIRLHIRFENDFYDFGGKPTRITSGVMLETLRIAASRYKCGMIWALTSETSTSLIFDITFPMTADQEEDRLAAWIERRSVNRWPYRMRALTESEKQALQSAVGDQFHIRWFETLADKWAVSRLNASAAWLRLSLPETFVIHQRIVDWNNILSPDRIPATAVGLDPLTRQLMKWVLGDWKRAAFLNRYLAGPLTPVIEMDIVPGLCCAAHFAFVCPQSASSREDTLISLGQALQRFWLTATTLGLVIQPTFASTVFSYYGEHGSDFSEKPGTMQGAKIIACKFENLYGFKSNQIPVVGRIGQALGAPPRSRSARRELTDLIYR